jgi:hypothetical protein
LVLVGGPLDAARGEHEGATLLALPAERAVQAACLLAGRQCADERVDPAQGVLPVVLLEGAREASSRNARSAARAFPSSDDVRHLDVDHDVVLPHRAGREHAWPTTLTATPVRVREWGTCLRL